MGPFNPSEYLWLIGLGLVVGMFGTLIGAGGGFILMPVLLLLHPNVSPGQLTAISLAVVFFNALSGSESYAMMKRIDYKSGLMFAAATIPGAIIGALNTTWMPRHLFNGIFGVSYWPQVYFCSGAPGSNLTLKRRTCTIPMSPGTWWRPMVKHTIIISILWWA